MNTDYKKTVFEFISLAIPTFQVIFIEMIIFGVGYSLFPGLGYQ